ncbi:MAG TPA: hypothetical protein VK034_10555 [Enhygromyxa sp.]|nr:hypothetical protein [Enhygromyxa sp.]
MRTHPRITRGIGPLAATQLLVALAIGGGCGAQQAAAEKLIDPQLRERGVLIERQTGGRDLELGRYRVEQLRLDEEPFDGTGPLAPDAAGRTRPTQQWRLGFSLAGGELRWEVECVGQRRQPPDHDLAAAADEPRDEVAAHCQLLGGEHRWVLRVDGSLAANISGRLEPAQGSVGRREMAIEIVMWHRLWNVSRRRLPASLALIHGDAGTEAALILDAPERAWLAVELEPVERELALAALLALRLLPLGFEG